MKKLLVAALIVPMALLGAARPAKAGNKAGIFLGGLMAGIGAALVIDALTSPPVVAAPAPVVYQPAPVIVPAPPPVYQAPPPVVYAPPPVVYAPPPVVYTPTPVVYVPPPVVYRPAPVIVTGPRHGPPPPHRVYHRDDHGKRRYWQETYQRRDQAEAGRQ